MSDADKMLNVLRNMQNYGSYPGPFIIDEWINFIKAQAARIGELERELADTRDIVGDCARNLRSAYDSVKSVRARATAAEAERDRLREALTDLVSWFDGGPSSYGPWIIRAGDRGADDAVIAARAALAHAEPSGNPGRLPGGEEPAGS